MGPDVPAPSRMEQKADTLQSGLSDLMDRNFWLAQSDRGATKYMDKTNNAANELTNQGQINRMSLPNGWVGSESQTGIAGNGTYLEYHLPTNSDVNLNFFFRGRSASSAASQNFHNLLSQTPHLLKPEELKQLKEIVRDKADEDKFSVLSARTKEWNGKTVLIVEGRYRKLQEDTFSIYVDADGSGKFVQEIYYQAPKSEYPHYLKQAKASLESIEWK